MDECRRQNAEGRRQKLESLPILHFSFFIPPSYPFPWGYFKMWKLDPNVGRFEKV